MKGLVSVCLVLFFFVFMSQERKAVTYAAANNDYPIILVHGVAGWGKEEMKNFYYWGGINDVEGQLNRNGYETYVASMGPLSSNRDRAAELYAFIKGGTVDYGAAHAAKHNHSRFGDTYPGVEQHAGAGNKVHLVGHSMGGQTARMLVEMLKSGSKEEKDYHANHPSEEPISPLFEGDQSWVHSVTTIATPHNGSPVSNQSEDFIPFLKGLVWKYITLAESHTGEQINYDFDLDHWGLKKKTNESAFSYMDRLFHHPFWETEDTAQYDLSLEGAKELNQQIHTYEDIYYFSYTGDATNPSVFTEYRLPIVTMNPIFYSTGFYVGRYSNSAFGIDQSWYANDGLVSVPSSQHPLGHPSTKNISNQPTKGVWNVNPTQRRWDHLDFVGIDVADSVGWSDINAYYREIASKLYNLPAN
ncbi:esterase/lipase family protein [Pontibacillus salicampi]|uniref:triacylglycerol lipase n=1 Tax=Pontibacillus salicampi TaxID=1449801 RepID=A0ABV6LR69_9BACI